MCRWNVLVIVFAAAASSACAAPQQACPVAAPDTDAASRDSRDVIALMGRDGFPDPNSPLAHLAELAMFDEQAAPLRALAARVRSRLSEIAAARATALKSLEDELDRIDRDEARVRALVAEVARLDAESTAVQIDARLETRRILRPDQLVKLRALRSATSL